MVILSFDIPGSSSPMRRPPWTTIPSSSLETIYWSRRFLKRDKRRGKYGCLKAPGLIFGQARPPRGTPVESKLGKRHQWDSPLPGTAQTPHGSTSSTPAEPWVRGTANRRPLMNSRNKLPVSKTTLIQSTVAIFLGIALLGWLSTGPLKVPLEIAANWVLDTLGIPGVLLFTIAVDSFPTPFSFVPLLVLCIHRGLDPLFIGFIFSAASISGGMTGYHLGRWFGLPGRLESWAEKKFPGCLDWLRDHAAPGIVAFTILPLPFSLATWTAGALRAHRGKVIMALCTRILKVGFIIGSMLLGQAAGG